MGMVKASDAAAALQMLADCLLTSPDLLVDQPSVYFNFKYGGDAERESFLEFAHHVMPRPFKKTDGAWGQQTLAIEYSIDAMKVAAWIERSKICRLVKPAQEAEYECEPLLSAEEEAALPSAADLDADAAEKAAAAVTSGEAQDDVI